MNNLAAHTTVIITAGMTLLACLMAAWRVAEGRRNPGAAPVSAERNRVPAAMLLAAAVAITVAPILGFWYSGTSTHVALGGLLPWNDGLSYFDCSLTILDGIPLSESCFRRPVYSLFLATLLAVAGRDLQIVLLAQGALFGTAAFLFARLVQAQWNAPAALVAFATLLGLAGPYGATTMSENAGLLYGVIGVYFIWRGAGTASTVAIAAGLFMLTIGLNARAGAFFVLPAVLIWSAFAAHERGRTRAIITAAGIAAVLAGFLFNYAALVSFGGDPQLGNANFSYTLYGITVGGKSWLQVYADHPGIFTEGGGTAVTTKKVYAAAIDNMLQRPHLFVWGYLRGLNHFVERQFRYVGYLPVRLLFSGLFWLGFVIAVRGWRDRRLSLLAALAAGVVASAPFITWDAGNRAFAATLPVDALVIANGFFAVQSFFLRRFSRNESARPAQESRYRTMAVLAAAVVAATLPAPLVLSRWTALSPVSGPSCENGRAPIVIRSGLESPFLRIVPSEAASLFPLEVPADGFRKGLAKNVHLGDVLARLPVDTVLLWGYQLHERDFGTRYRLVWENGTPPARGTTMRLCTREESYDGLPNFFAVTSAQPLTD